MSLHISQSSVLWLRSRVWKQAAQVQMVRSVAAGAGVKTEAGVGGEYGGGSLGHIEDIEEFAAIEARSAKHRGHGQMDETPDAGRGLK